MAFSGTGFRSEDTKIVELVDRLSRIAHTIQFSHGLNPAQWEALRFVARANRTSCSPGALAEFMGCTKGTVSQTLKALECKGLIARQRVEDDRRSVRLTLTADGEDVLRKDPLGMLHGALDGYSDGERTALVEGMKRLLGAVQRSQGMAEFGQCADCTHYRPEACHETNSTGCRCAVSGELFSGIEIDKICADFSRAR